MIFLEYIWLDGSYPQKLRSKTKILDKDKQHILHNIPKMRSSGMVDDHETIKMWNFDGSSTGQADVHNSEMMLHPANIFIDPFREDSFLVLCEVFNPDGTPHSSNKRSKLREMLVHDKDTCYGFEQEYFIYRGGFPLGWKPTMSTDGSTLPIISPTKPQGEFYCSVGGDNIECREFVEEHTRLCLKSKLNISGTNMEVAQGQAEYQIGMVNALNGSDELWISRYILERLSEKYSYKIELDPKPYKGNDINGSGMHCNFSTHEMRNNLKDKKMIVIEACEKLGKRIQEHISVYGTNNEHRLTGQNETSSIEEFKYGIGDRTASIRIPSNIEDRTSMGYLEDRRPASNADPYEICTVMIETICKE